MMYYPKDLLSAIGVTSAQYVNRKATIRSAKVVALTDAKGGRENVSRRTGRKMHQEGLVSLE